MVGDVGLIPGSTLIEGDPTPGMRREVALQSERLWCGLVHTEPGAASGWHHHGEHETALYIVAGEVRIEFGPDGRESAAAVVGDFLVIAPHAVHREINPGATTSTAVIARAGRGTPTVNVAGPAPGPVTGRQPRPAADPPSPSGTPPAATR